MTLYAPRHDPLVFTGDSDSKRSLATGLPRILSGVSIVAGIGLVGQWAVQSTDLLRQSSGSVGPAGTDATGSVPTTLLFEPAVLLFFGALLMGIVVLLLEAR